MEMTSPIIRKFQKGKTQERQGQFCPTEGTQQSEQAGYRQLHSSTMNPFGDQMRSKAAAYVGKQEDWRGGSREGKRKEHTN